MEEPKISVVMSMYNSESFLKECIDSILNQTFTDFELIIVDDGSTDNSVDIIKTYSDNRLKLVLCEHNYIHSLNEGISMARGKYIARMDADDIMQSNRLAVEYSFMEDNLNIDICGSKVKFFGKKQTIPILYINNIDIITALMFQCTLFHSTVIMRRKKVFSVYKKKGICQLYNKKYPYAEDYYLWTDMAMKGFVFANIPQVLVYYRSSNTQLTTIHAEEMQPFLRKVQANYAEYIEILINKFGNEQLQLFYKTNLTMLSQQFISRNTFLKTSSRLYKNILENHK